MKTFLGRDKFDWAGFLIVFTVVMGLALAFSCEPVHAFSETQAVQAIVGESLADYKSMYAIACALRNRGSLRGVYGVHAKHAQEPEAYLWQRASRAWADSEEGEDVVHGADHWLSDYDISHGKPKLIKFRLNMVETAYIGKTHFYKKI